MKLSNFCKETFIFFPHPLTPLPEREGSQTENFRNVHPLSFSQRDSIGVGEGLGVRL